LILKDYSSPSFFIHKLPETAHKRKEIFKMEEQERKTKVDRAAQKVKQAQAEYRKAVREQKKQEQKAQDRHKYMMGGCVQKYFPEGLNVFDFNELEMNRIIACAFSLKDVQNMINTVIKERPDPDSENDEEEVADNEAESDDSDDEE
jgi:hypothetical protein